MAFNFPGPPLTIGQTFSPSPGITYIWTGAAWDRVVTKTGVPAFPAGVVMAFAGTVLPAGALWCDGATFDQVAYPMLYAALGNSNVTPDLRGRTIIGLDRQVAGAFANRVTNSGVGHPGLDSRTMKATGGFDRYTIAQAQMPSHTHDGSGTSSNVSADHSHYNNFTSGTDAPDHAHHLQAWDSVAGSHNHGLSYAPTKVSTASGTADRVGGGYTNADTVTSTGGSHQHLTDSTSWGANARHAHSVVGWTGGISANHTHTYSFTSTAKGGGEAHPIMQPSMVLNYIVWTGAIA